MAEAEVCALVCAFDFLICGDGVAVGPSTGMGLAPLGVCVDAISC
jgi:hypothetical protein